MKWNHYTKHSKDILTIVGFVSFITWTERWDKCLGHKHSCYKIKPGVKSVKKFSCYLQSGISGRLNSDYLL